MSLVPLLSAENVKELFLEAFIKTVKNTSQYAKWSVSNKHLARRGIKKQFGEGFNTHLRIGTISTSDYLQSTITNGVAELIIVDDKRVSEFAHIIEVINFLQANEFIQATLSKNLAVFMCKDGVVKLITKDYTADSGKRLILVVDMLQ